MVACIRSKYSFLFSGIREGGLAWFLFFCYSLLIFFRGVLVLLMRCAPLHRQFVSSFCWTVFTATFDVLSRTVRRGIISPVDITEVKNAHYKKAFEGRYAYLPLVVRVKVDIYLAPLNRLGRSHSSYNLAYTVGSSSLARLVMVALPVRCLIGQYCASKQKLRGPRRVHCRNALSLPTLQGALYRT